MIYHSGIFYFFGHIYHSIFWHISRSEIVILYFPKHKLREIQDRLFFVKFRSLTL